MNSARKQRWQQATALVSLSTAGAMTGISFAHGTPADMTSPTSMPTHLLAFTKPTKPASTGDGALRSAIVSAAKYYLSLARGKTPAEMEALIWQDASTDGADHGESCAAFASLTLETGAQATGQQSWVTGGSTYPWPLHKWADVRVDPNPESPGIVSVLQDAEANHRWHPLGDGYTPQPGDWVMFTGHVEVVTKYSGGVLYTIGGDSMPNLSVNAHQYDDPLGAQGVTGIVNNGELVSSQAPAPAVEASLPSSQSGAVQVTAEQGQAVILGMAPPGNAIGGAAGSGGGSAPQAAPPADDLVVLGSAAIPAAPTTSASGSGGAAGHRYSRTQASPSAAQASDTAAQQAFIQQVAPGAIEAQRQYGIPAAVTIAQAIDESGWGQSQLAAQDNNLFGIKGTGPAGSVMLPTQEYESGQWVTVSAPFRVYNSVAESIADHSLLLASGSSYKQAMADRKDPDAFANDLTGVYATDPSYGANLITIMRLYNLYRYGAGSRTGAMASSSSSGSGGLSGVARLGTGLGSGAQGGLAQGSPAQGSAAQGSPAEGGAAQGGAAQGGAASDGTLGGVVNYGPALGVTGDGATVDDQALQAVAGLAAKIPGVAGVGSGGRQGGVRRNAERTNRTEQDAGAASRMRTSGAGGGGASQTSSAAGGSRRTAAGASGSRRGSARVAASGQAVSGQAVSGQAVSGQGGSGHGGSGQGGSGRGGSGRGGSRRSVPSRSQPGTAGGGAAAPAAVWPGSGGGGASGRGSAALGGARIPGLVPDSSGAASEQPLRAGPRNARISTRRYVPQIPQAVTMAFVTSAKTPLLRSEPLYRDVARDTGVRWQLLAACDWMQCQAQQRVSPVYGEKLGTKNSDGTVYRTKSSALEQCARDLIDLAGVVYGIDLTERLYLSICDLASVFAAFRWGGLLAAHHISAMEFPYSVEGLTTHHVKMRWPDIPDTPKSDKGGARFPMAFGAVPVVLGLDYPAVA